MISVDDIRREIEEEIRKYGGFILDEDQAIFFFKELFEREGVLTAIFGARGSGKTALAIRLGEIAKEQFGRKVQVFHPYQYPEFETVRNIREVENSAFVILDETQLRFHARRSMRRENVEMSNWITILRHKGVNLVFTTQSTFLIDKVLISQANLMILKKPPLYSLPLEKSVFAEMIRWAYREFARLPEARQREMFIVHSERYYNWLWRKYGYYAPYIGPSVLDRMLFQAAFIRGRAKLPKYWSETLSHMFSEWEMEAEVSSDLGRLPEEFTSKEVAEEFNISRRAAQYRIKKWRELGLVEEAGRGRYRKVAKLEAAP